MNNDEKLVQGLKMVIEAFSEMISEKNNQSKTTSTVNSVSKIPRVMKIPQDAEYSGLSKNQVYTLMRQKKLKHFRAGNI